MLDLGVNVVLRPKGDGTQRVLFLVPAARRPPSWPPSIPLPINGPRTGDLSKFQEVREIRRDAARLNDQLNRARNGEWATDNEKTISHLIRLYQKSEGYKNLSPATQRNYHHHMGQVLEWSEFNNNPDPTHMTRQDIEEFLALYDDRPSLKKLVHNALSIVMERAVIVGWRPDNPAKGIRIKLPPSRVTLWTRDDVLFWSAEMVARGQPGMAGVIQCMWEIGQRRGDVLRFQHGKDYVDGAFRFRQSKTGAYVSVKCSDALRNLIDKLKTDSPYVFAESNGEAYSDGQAYGLFNAAQRARRGQRTKLDMLHLRHSAVVQMALSGCSIPEIAAVTGHVLNTVYGILGRYLQPDSAMADAAQVKRGLIDPSRASESFDSYSNARMAPSEPPKFVKRKRMLSGTPCFRPEKLKHDR